MYAPAAIDVHSDPSPRMGFQTENPFPIPNLRSNSMLKDWLDWAALNNRGVRAAALEWVLMDPTRAQTFCNNINKSSVFRSKFRGLYIPIVAAVERLGGSDFETPAFIEQKLAKIRSILKEEERLLSVMRAEVTAREARVEVLRSALESADKKDWELVIGFETRLPRLPPRPSVRRTRRKPKVDESSRDPEWSRKRKR